MKDSFDIQEAISWYKREKPTYEKLAKNGADLIGELCAINSIQIHAIEFRAKEASSFEQKAKNDHIKYSFKDMQDLAGVRVIVYTKKDCEKVIDVIKKYFSVKMEQDISARLGTDKVGYQSRHIIVSLSDDRIKLPENEIYNGKNIEIQIRTILQHSWAQISHSQDYKGAASLPSVIKRNLGLIAGMLEVSDNEFQRLIDEIKDYKEEVSEKTQSGDLNISINALSLREFLDNEFKGYVNIENKFGPNDDMVDDVIEELNKFEIKKLYDLNNIINTKFKEALKREYYSTYLGLLRDAMIVCNPDKFFSTAWNKKWTFGDDKEEAFIFKEFDIDVEGIKNKYFF